MTEEVLDLNALKNSGGFLYKKPQKGKMVGSAWAPSCIFCNNKHEEKTGMCFHAKWVCGHCDRALFRSYADLFVEIYGKVLEAKSEETRNLNDDGKLDWSGVRLLL